MVKITKVKTGTKLEEVSSYSRIVAVDDWIFVSNTAGRNPETKEIPAEVTAQTHQVFDNIERALKAVDASLADVVSTRVFIQNPEDTPTVMGIFGDRFRVEVPTGSGNQLTLAEAADALDDRLVDLFRPGPDGRRPADGARIEARDSPLWRDHVTFSEYFHGDTGEGLGATHQTGWTALVAHILCTITPAG